MTGCDQARKRAYIPTYIRPISAYLRTYACERVLTIRVSSHPCTRTCTLLPTLFSILRITLHVFCFSLSRLFFRHFLHALFQRRLRFAIYARVRSVCLAAWGEQSARETTAFFAFFIRWPSVHHNAALKFSQFVCQRASWSTSLSLSVFSRLFSKKNFFFFFFYLYFRGCSFLKFLSYTFISDVVPINLSFDNGSIFHFFFFVVPFLCV